MAEDAVFNIVIGVQNRERIQQLEKDIADAEKEINNLSAAINTAGQATTQQANQLRMYGKDIYAYRNEIEQLSKENIKLGETADSFGSRGVTSMVRGLKQIAEGSESLVTTIPRVAMTLGASGELALALGTTAVAIDELGKHWDELKDLMGDTSFLDNVGTQLKAIGDSMLANMGLPSIGDWWSTWEAMAEQKLAEAKSKKKAEGLEAQAASLPKKKRVFVPRRLKKHCLNMAKND